MRISDWSSDVCSSDLLLGIRGREIPKVDGRTLVSRNVSRYIRTGKYIPVDVVVGYVQRAEQLLVNTRGGDPVELATLAGYTLDRKSVVDGKSVSVRVDIGGRRYIKKKNDRNTI